MVTIAFVHDLFETWRPNLLQQRAERAKRRYTQVLLSVYILLQQRELRLEIDFPGQRDLKASNLSSVIPSYARHLELEVDERLNIAGLNLYNDVDDHYNQQCLQDERHTCHKALGPL